MAGYYYHALPSIRNPAMNKARILIVEDEAIIAMDIESILREYEYRIAGMVVTGEEALAAVKARTPDLILMDILLAGQMDGIEAARLIRRSFDIPVIYVSANADEATVERARDTEPYGYINKPINRKDLYSNIESALYKHAMEKRIKASEERYRDLVENINDAIYTLDSEGVFTYVSPVIRRMGKYEEAEVIGKHFSNFIHPDDLEGLNASVRRTIAGKLEPYEYRLLDKDGRVAYVRTSSRPIMKNGVYAGMTGIITDITERRHSEAALREREARLDSILRAAPIGIGVVIDRVIMQANDRLCGMTGYPREELIGQSALLLYPTREEYEFVGREKYAQISEAGTGTVETRWRRRDGVVIDVLLSSSPIEPANLSAGVSFTAMDITRRKKTEALLCESEERFRGTFEGSFTPMALCDLKGRFLEVNDALCEMTGYSRRELLGRTYRAITYSGDLKLGTRHMQSLLKGEQSHFHLEQRYLHKDGGIIWAVMSASIINDTAGSPLYFSMQVVDITARKAAEGAIKKTQYLLSESQRMAGMGSVEFNSQTGEIFCTDETYRILGIESDGRPLAAKEFARLIHPDDAEAFNDSLRDCLHGNKKLDVAYRIVRPDGTVRHVKSLGNAIRERDGKAVMMIGTIMDITEQVRADELIRNSLREKEIMLREIHHRVKNNFQFLISILDIQSERLSDPEALNIFSNARNRIRLISMVHEKLYQARDLSHIDIADYIRSLVDYLRQSMSEHPGNVTVSLRVGDVDLGINRAMTCGLIINELVSNTLRHAYPHGGRVKIRIEFSPTGKEYMLRISDGGVGFPRGLDFRATTSLGMQLVCMFVEQLGGNITLIQRKGTEFRISFPQNK